MNKGLRLLGRAYRRLRTKWSGACAVLLYHRVAEPATDPWDLRVSPERFRDQLIGLKRAGYKPVSLEEAITESTVRARRFAVSFDDGYLDNLLDAQPVLKQEGVPATVFATAGHIGEAATFWWDEIEILAFETSPLPGALDLKRQGVHLVFDAGQVAMPSCPEHDSWKAWLPAQSARHAFYLYLYQELSLLDPGKRSAVIGELWSWAGRDRISAQRLIMNEHELRSLAESGIEVGSHAITHRRLADLAPGEQAQEIAGSRDLLQRMTGKSVNGFSYPHGACSEATFSMTRNAGYQYACTSRSGLLHGRDNTHAVPRLEVKNWTGQDLVSILNGYF